MKAFVVMLDALFALGIFSFLMFFWPHAKPPNYNINFAIEDLANIIVLQDYMNENKLRIFIEKLPPNYCIRINQYSQEGLEFSYEKSTCKPNIPVKSTSRIVEKNG